MTQPTEPNGCVGCVGLVFIGFWVFWFGSYVYQSITDAGKPNDWRCWDTTRLEWTREVRKTGSNCYYDP